jgi:hypothetical protein
MIELLNDTTKGLPCIVHAPTYVKRRPPISLTDALAAFLIGSGGAPHTYFQYSAADWTVDSSWSWSSLYEIAYGDATGPPTITYYGMNTTAPKTGEVWERQFDHGNITVTVNCTPPEMRIAWCKGDISWPGKPTRAPTPAPTPPPPPPPTPPPTHVPPGPNVCKESTFLPDKRYHHGYAVGQAPAASALACCKQCAAGFGPAAGCLFFSFVNTTSSCSYLSSDGTPVPDEGTTSGPVLQK